MSETDDGADNGADNGADSRTVTFIQYDIPPLKSGEYTVTLTHTVNQTAPNSFGAAAQFAVAGERFSFDPSDIHCVFPPDLANGEYAGVLPHVAFNRRTLPWERDSIDGGDDAPWLAVLLFNEDEAPTPRPLTAKDLVAAGQAITAYGSDVKGTGALPANYFSYPGINPLDYGETPDDQCFVIDVPLATFNRVAPSAEDLPYLAQIREVDTSGSEDHTDSSIQYAIVLGNRVGIDNVKSYAFLVSLENMGDYLPASDGTPSARMPAGTEFVRLVTFRYWSYTANELAGTFKGLVENLNKGDGQRGLSTLQYPFAGTAPDDTAVQTALQHQAAGALTAADAQALVFNALQMGYVPLNHHLRRAGQTVSWYRGPLAPLPVPTTLPVPIAGPDAANRYNPQTGMFDVSYGAAWQLGQLLALQNTGYATALYNWKRTVEKSQAVAEEQELITEMLQDPAVLESFFGTRSANVSQAAEASAPPDLVVQWLANLMLLNGVPFQYLVPDESMLPPESLRLFYLDFNWMAALFDGAYSIGRATTGEAEQDAATSPQVNQSAADASRTARLNPAPETTYTNTTGQVTGFLMRSQVVSGWPRVSASGYADTGGTTEIPKLRLSRLSADVLLCLFDGPVQMVAIHEPPEQLHSGVQGAPGQFTTPKLRAVSGATPGAQFTTDPKGGQPVAQAPTRADNQTLKIKATADNILNKLNADFGQGLSHFTSAEFALEMVMGVVKVEFLQTS